MCITHISESKFVHYKGCWGHPNLPVHYNRLYPMFMELTAYRVSYSRCHRLWSAGRCRSEAEQGAYRSTGHTHSYHSYDSDAKRRDKTIVRTEKKGERMSE